MAKSVKADKGLKKAKRTPKAAAAAAAKALPRASKRRSRATVAASAADASVLDRIYKVVLERRKAPPSVSHSARLLARGTTKVAQKFGEEAVECLIEAVAGNHDALVGESADVLYHLLVLWVDAGVQPEQVWAELTRREGVSGIAEKASRVKALPRAPGLHTTKIP